MPLQLVFKLGENIAHPPAYVCYNLQATDSAFKPYNSRTDIVYISFTQELPLRA